MDRSSGPNGPAPSGPLLPIAYLTEQNIVFRLVCLLESPRGEDVHLHAGQLLKSLVEHLQQAAPLVFVLQVGPQGKAGGFLVL